MHREARTSLHFAEPSLLTKQGFASSSLLGNSLEVRARACSETLYKPELELAQKLYKS